MIIWINGTFGAGKTTTAAELLPLIPEARFFDPETVGYMLQPNLADHPVTDFQHWPPWRRLVVATMTEIIGFTGQHLIASQTVLDQSYLTEIFDGLRAGGLEVFHVLLDPDPKALRKRIERSPEATQWRLDHLDEYAAARSWMVSEADLVMDTTHIPADQAAGLIASAIQPAHP
jgi:hypothetical protein